MFVSVLSYHTSFPRYYIRMPSICRSSRSNNLYYYIIVVLPRAPESPYTFFWQLDPYGYSEVGSIFFYIFCKRTELEASSFNVKRKPISLKTCQYLDLTSVGWFAIVYTFFIRYNFVGIMLFMLSKIDYRTFTRTYISAAYGFYGHSGWKCWQKNNITRIVHRENPFVSRGTKKRAILTGASLCPFPTTFKCWPETRI